MGGFLLPMAIDVDRPGWRARLYRAVRRRLRWWALYERGREMVPAREWLERVR